MAAIPRIIIAGTHSGCGKTTIAGGLMAAMAAEGHTVQPFKVGPDFIDPTHHSKICGRASRNLDPFMMGEAGVSETFCRASAGAGIAVVEGVMGLYDGLEETGCASTAHVARILRAPVILVVDAGGMSRSIHALIDGFRRFDPGIEIAGIIVNRIGSPHHRAIIESSGSAPFVGWIPRRDELVMKSRHLGLAMAHETGPMEKFGDVARECCDLDAIVRIAQGAPDLPGLPAARPLTGGPRARIGVAFDPAFCFYYEDNLDRLRDAGADLVFFSPISDRLPPVDGIYLGGGYPELYLDPLAASRCRDDIRHAAGAGMPVYGECGGLMYLTREVAADRTFSLCGILPATTEMTGKIQALGYVDGKTGSASPVFPAGLPVRGHEFHFSRVDPDRDARFSLVLSRGKGICDGKDGIVSGNVVGAYTHAYFSPAFARSFVACCAGSAGKT